MLNFVEAALAHDLKLPANVYEVDYAGLREGITLSTDRGPDPLRPRQPAVTIGHRFVQRDHATDRERGPLGAVLHHRTDGTVRLHRAFAHEMQMANGNWFWLLRRPLQDEVDESLVRVTLQLPAGVVVEPVSGYNGREYTLHIQQGVNTDGKVLSADQEELLVRLKDGQSLSIFFADGQVRQLAQKKGELVEIILDSKGMVKARIADATRRLEKLELNERLDEEERVKARYKFLSGMVDLLHLLRAEPALLEEVVKTFFFQLPDWQLAIVHRKLLAVLHLYDSVLTLALTAPARTTVVPFKGETVDRDGAKAKAEALVRKKLRSEEEKARRLALKGPSGGVVHHSKKRGSK